MYLPSKHAPLRVAVDNITHIKPPCKSISNKLLTLLEIDFVDLILTNSIFKIYKKYLTKFLRHSVYHALSLLQIKNKETDEWRVSSVSVWRVSFGRDINIIHNIQRNST
jgi:hypothetical protein